MDIPNDLKIAIEKNIESIDKKQLNKDAENISLKYRENRKQQEALVSLKNEVNAYSVVRMPATYGATYTALKHSIIALDKMPKSLLDIGAGTGAATWAATSLLELQEITCFEREKEMCQLGQNLMNDSTSELKKTKWIQGNILKDPIPSNMDLVIAAYVFNEMSEEEQEKGLLKLWEATKLMLLIVEPGTPNGFSRIRKARKLLIENGGHILAPCPHENDCPLENNDWCHFACRIPRSRLHREAKQADVPYEDEKYTYIAVTRNKQEHACSRVLRHPFIEKGQVTLQLCTKDGINKNKISKRDKTLYKKARKVKWGDSFEYVKS